VTARVTGQTQVATAIANLRAQTARQAKLQDQIGSGTKLALPSDGPAEYAAAARGKAASQRFDVHLQSIATATADLNAGVSALTQTNRLLSKASQLAQEGVNGATDAVGYEALATELDGVIDQAITLANSKQDGRSLFAGTATDTPAFAVTRDAAGKPTAVQYTGSGDRAAVIVGPGQATDTRYVGSAVFQQSGGDVFAALIGLRDDLRNGSLTGTAKAAALTARLSDLEAARTAVGGAVAEQSASLVTLDATSARIRDLKLDTDARTGELEGTDYTEAVVKMKEQDGVFEATLAVTAKLMQPSLLDFIR
jgi:flagellar hook-associated protein 3 FlgL